jgi:hypothetical protein
MATSPAGQPKPRREMQEVKAPDQFKFDKEGATLEGVFLSIEPKIVNEKQVNEYMFQLDNGERATCLGMADLDRKIEPKYLGHFMSIRYERDDGSFQKPGQSKMKVFKVTVDKNIAPGFEHLKVA